MKYYKIKSSYNSEDDIIITEDELPKAMWSFITKVDFVSFSGAIRGDRISSIIPDYSMSMGWNRGYKPNGADWVDVKRKLGSSLEEEISNVKYLIDESKGSPNIFKNLLSEYTESKKLLSTNSVQKIKMLSGK